MDPKWERFDNILTDLWDFLVPPLLNAFVLLVIFYEFTIQIFASIGDIFVGTLGEESQLREAYDFAINLVNNTVSSIEKIQEIVDQGGAAIASIIASGAAGALIVFLILVFILHRVTMAAGHIIFGRLDLDEAQLPGDPIVASQLNATQHLIPTEITGFHDRWMHMKAIVDTSEGLPLYRSARARIEKQIIDSKNYMTYSEMYFIGAVFTILWAPFDSEIELTPLSFLIVPAFLLSCLYFSRTYFDLCRRLFITDSETYSAIMRDKSHSWGDPEIPLRESTKPTHDLHFLSHVKYMDFFEGGLIQRLLDLRKTT